MKKLSILFLCIFSIVSVLSAQDESSEEDIVYIIDDLRIQWDEEAINLESFEGMEEYCHVKHYRTDITNLLNKIHHYDTTLYNIITVKHAEETNLEAKETLKQILVVESKYTTPNFLEFLKAECDKVRSIEKHAKKTINDVEAETEELEQELYRYIEAVTVRIDLIDENIHHLEGME